MAKTTVSTRQASGRTAVISALKGLSLQDMKNEQELIECQKLLKLLVGEPKPRKRRSAAKKEEPATSM